MIVRLICLGLAVVVVAAGLADQSLALCLLAAGIAALALAGLDGGRAQVPCQGQRSRAPSWASAHLTQRTVVLGAGAVTFAIVTLAISAHDALVLPGVLTWLLAIGLMLAFGFGLDRLTLADARATLGRLAAREQRPELLSVAAIVVVAAALRFYQLETVPPAVHGDEGEMGDIALRILAGETIPFFKTAPFWGPTYPFNYVQAFVIWLFGPSVASLRTVSVLSGVLCVAVVYAIGRVGWGPVAATLAAWLMAVSHVHNHYSRLAQIFMSATLLSAVTLLLLALAARQAEIRARRAAAGDQPPDCVGRGVWSLLIAAGAVAGVSQYIYHSTRIVPLIAGLLLLVMLRAHWIGRWHLAAFGLAFVLTYAPLAAFYVESPLDFSTRLREVSAFQEWYVREALGPGAELPRDTPALLAEQARRTLGLFVRATDRSGFYSDRARMLDVVTAALIWLGLGAAVARLRRYHEAALLVWCAIGLIFGGMLTIGAQNAHRILIMLPAAFLLGGVALARAWEVIRATPLRRLERLAAPIGTALALWLLAANVVVYFYEYVPRWEIVETTLIAREMRRDGDRYRFYFLTEPRFYPNHGPIKYLAHGIRAENLKTAAELTVPPDDGRGIVVFALEHLLPELRALEARLPGGQETRVTAPDGRLLYIRYEVPPSS